jgi:hypothetical protein
MLQDGTNEVAVCLTEAEALGLLDMIMLSPTDLTPEQRAAMMKLSDFCREFLRDNTVSADNPRTAGGHLRAQCAA